VTRVDLTAIDVMQRCSDQKGVVMSVFLFRECQLICLQWVAHLLIFIIIIRPFL